MERQESSSEYVPPGNVVVDSTEYDLNPFKEESSVPYHIKQDEATAWKVFHKRLSDLSDGQRAILQQASISPRNDVVKKLTKMWSTTSQTYDAVRARLYDRWYGSAERKKFEMFIDVLRRSPVNKVNIEIEHAASDGLTWAEQVEKTWGLVGKSAAEYFELEGDVYGWLLEPNIGPYKFDGVIRPQTFCNALAGADWRRANDESAFVNHQLLDGFTGDHSQLPDFRLNGTFEDVELGLKINGRILSIPDSGESIAELYAVSQLNPKILLGLRIHPLNDLEKGQHDALVKGNGDLLVIPLGHVLCTEQKTIEQWHISDEESHDIRGSVSNDTNKWEDTGFVLLLEIEKNGSPGAYYIIYNVTYLDADDQPHMLTVSDDRFDTRRLNFCRRPLSFTVAKVGYQFFSLPELVDKAQHELDAEKFDVAIGTLSHAKDVHGEDLNLPILLQKAYRGRVFNQRQNFYQILGVDPNVTPAELRSAYRRQMQRHHPDKARQTGEINERKVHERAAAINEAFNVLDDPEQRARLDNLMRQHEGPFHGAFSGSIRNGELAASFLVPISDTFAPIRSIQLEVKSQSTPEIVETGMRGPVPWSEGGEPPIGLFSNISSG